jgi:RHS repeat-associated protein
MPTSSFSDWRSPGLTDGDTADLTLKASNQVVEATIGLPGGVLYTFKPATPAGSVWSYPNLAGSVVAVADQVGVKQGATRWWDPDGNPLGATVVPDNSAGAFDYGWLGGHQRPVEQLAGLTQTVQMGARQYLPRLGRFLQVDPVEGGGANDYAYPHDPVNMSDLDGKFWKCKWCRKAWNRTKRFVRDHRHTIVNIGVGVVAASAAAWCVATVVCGIGMAAGGAAAIMAGGTAAHLGSDRLTRSRRGRYSFRRAAWESGVSTLVGGVCGATLGRGCALGAVTRGRTWPKLAMGAGGLATGWMLKYRGRRRR